MKRLLAIELQKIWKNRASKVLTISYFVILSFIALIASQGTTILLASHLLDEVEKVCSHVLVLRYGKILYSGTVDGMSNQNCFFELQADSNSRLIETLKNHPEVEKISEVEGKVVVHFKRSEERRVGKECA